MSSKRERCSSCWVPPEGEFTNRGVYFHPLTLCSGCTTLLKTIAGEMNGIYLDSESELNYRGISAKEMTSRFRGEAIYTAEVDVHFPKLTVGETLA